MNERPSKTLFAYHNGPDMSEEVVDYSDPYESADAHYMMNGKSRPVFETDENPTD